MPFVDRSRVEETSVHVFGCDASDLGWKPGYWPSVVETNLGNRLDLYVTKLNSAGAEYEQVGGCIKVIVWND
jgi:hypothetical protein